MNNHLIVSQKVPSHIKDQVQYIYTKNVEGELKMIDCVALVVQVFMVLVAVIVSRRC